jgi:hypothetical protein
MCSLAVVRSLKAHKLQRAVKNDPRALEVRSRNIVFAGWVGDLALGLPDTSQVRPETNTNPHPARSDLLHWPLRSMLAN